MKILLINPPNCGKSIPEEKYGIGAVKLIFRGEPLALSTVAGNLDGHAVEITDLKVTPEALRDDLDRFTPDVVGITAMTCEANTAVRIAREIKRQGGPVIVVGGHHASTDPEFFNRDGIDYVVAGLGKLSFRELIDALEKGGDGEGIPGVAKTRPGGPLAYVSRRYSAADLVDAKPPRYDLVARHRDHYVMSGVGGKMGFVASAHGCTHRCVFCCVPHMTGGRYLAHSVDAVIRDMETLADIPMIRLVDANTFGNIAAARELGERIRDLELKKPMVADVRSDTVVRHPDLFALWKSAGLAVAVIGFEEVSDDTLNSYDKRSAVAVNIEAMGILKALGIRVIGDFIVSPDYGRDDFARLEAFVATHAVDLPIPSILTPVPGTLLHAKFRDRITVHDLDYYTFLNAVMPTRLPEKTFYETYSAMLERFLSRATTHKESE